MYLKITECVCVVFKIKRLSVIKYKQHSYIIHYVICMHLLLFTNEKFHSLHRHWNFKFYICARSLFNIQIMQFPKAA